MVTRIIDGDDRLKKRSRTSPGAQFKELSLTKQRIGARTKKTCEQKTNNEKVKFGSNKITGMSYERIRKTIKKKIRSEKSKKTAKSKQHCRM